MTDAEAPDNDDAPLPRGSPESELDELDRAILRSLCGPCMTPEGGVRPFAQPASTVDIFNEVRQTIHLKDAGDVRARLKRLYRLYGIGRPHHGKMLRLVGVVYERGVIAGWGGVAMSTPGGDPPATDDGGHEEPEPVAPPPPAVSSSHVEAPDDAADKEPRSVEPLPAELTAAQLEATKQASLSAEAVAAELARDGRPQRPRRRFTLVALGVFTLVCLGVGVGVLVAGLLGGDASSSRAATSVAPAQSAATVGAPARAPARVPARVLVLIDVTGTMKEDLNPDVPGEGSRINAARSFAAERIDLLRAPDRIAVWLVTNSPDGLKDCRWVAATHCVLQPFTSATTAVREDLMDRLDDVTANNGGTPLYPAMRLGVRELKADREHVGLPRAVNSLIVVSDGKQHLRHDRGNSKTALTAAADGAHGVQILITATSDDLCNDELAEALEGFASECVDASSKAKARAAARDVIVPALRTPLARDPAT